MKNRNINHSDNSFGLLMIAVIVMIGVASTLIWRHGERLVEQASSFTHYSDSTWRVNDTVYWRHGADTIKLDVSKLK